MKIAVFGGTGFIGVHVCAALARAGHEVVAISRRRAAISDEIEHRVCDAITAIDASVLADCEGVVNLIGIKRPRGGTTFEAAHVDATRHILAAMDQVGLARLVHVSVSASRSSPDPYLDTKHRGEQLVRQSDTRWTILRPAVVYGSGDDMLHHLVSTLRHAPVFPAPDGGRAPLAVVDVEDVAAAVVACFEHPESIHQALDVVGPEPIPLRALVERVAAAISLPTRVVGVPGRLLRPAARVMQATMRDPPITRAQLNMLSTGVVGDPEPTRRTLGIEPRPLDDARIQAAAAEPGNQTPAFGISLRGGWPARALLGIAILNAASLVTITGTAADHWWRVGGTYVLAFALLGRWLHLPWRTIARVDAKHVLQGLAGGVVLYAATGVGSALAFALIPDLQAQAREVYGFARALPMTIAVPTLVAIVAAEDVYWRAAVGFVLAERARPWVAITVAASGFCISHLTLGPPLLWLAALVCGAFWTWLLIRTRSLIACFVAHLSWDVAVLWLWPLA